MTTLQQHPFFRPARIASAVLVLSLLLLIASWFIELPQIIRLSSATAILCLLYSLIFLGFGRLRGAQFRLLAAAIVSFTLLFTFSQLLSYFVNPYLIVRRVTPVASLAFFFISTAVLLLLLDRDRYLRFAQVMLIIGSSVGYIGLLGHAYLVPEFTGVDSMLMSLPGAICILALCYCYLMLYDNQGILQPFNTLLEGGRMGRSFLPAVIFLPLAVGYLRLFGHWYGWFSTEFGVSLIIGSLSSLFSVMLYFSMKVVNKRDQIRMESELALERKNVELQELTKELQRVSEELQATNEEYLSLNEELQASNEEVSANNEQLTALNDQLHQANKKIQEQSHQLVQQKQREYDLSEGSLRSILQNTDHSYLILNTDFTLRAFNRAAAEGVYRNTGKKLLMGSHIFDFMEASTHQNFLEILIRVRKGEKVTYVRDVPTPHGKKWYLITASPVHTIDNEFVGYCLATVDQTELRQSQAELSEERNLLRIIIDHLPLNVYVKDLQSRKTLANKAEYEYLGFATEEELLGKSDEDLYPTESSTISIEEDQDVFKTGRSIINKETINVRKDGKKTYFLISKIPLYNGSREIMGLVGLSYDITPRITAEHKLRELNDRFTLLSRATNDAIFDWDYVTHQGIWNHGVETIFGYFVANKLAPVTEWTGYVHPEDQVKTRIQLFRHFVLRKPVWTMRFRFQCADGTYKHVLNRAFIIYSAGKPIRIIGALQDVTEVTVYRQNLERLVAERTKELNDALNAEREVIEMKSRFISIASHEFRTPLTTISLTSGYLKRYETKIDAAHRLKKLDLIDKQVSHMTSLLDDVLMLGKAEAGKIFAQWELTSLVPLIEEIVDEIQLASDQIKVKTQWISVPKLILMDPKLFHNILANLLTNAIKFSPSGRDVELTVTGEYDHLILGVKDYGMGIPSDDVPTLFEPFQRGGNVASIQGTGLGLSIVKKSVELLGGTIRVTSTLGEGSEFVVTLPIKSE